MKEKIIRLLPVLRGALAETCPGPKLRFSEKPAPEKSPQIDPDCFESEEKLVRFLTEEFIPENKKAGKLPSGIAVPGAGFISAAWNYDDYDTADGLPPAPEESGRLKGKIALVTGGAQGFGKGIARELVSEGAFVFIADINAGLAGKAADELNSDFGKTISLPLKVDVCKEDSVSEMAGKAVSLTGGLDLYVSNAGVLKAGSVKEMSKADFEFVTGVNYTGYFLGVKHIAPVMAMHSAANPAYFTDIIQINSKSGLAGSNRNGAYAGGKFGGIGLTQSFALELVENNIKVNSICPGNFFEGPLWSDPEKGLFVQYLSRGKVPGAKTIEDVKKHYESQVPMKRGCCPEDIAKAIFYCVEQLYETGQAVPVTGGQIMLK